MDTIAAGYSAGC